MDGNTLFNIHFQFINEIELDYHIMISCLPFMILNFLKHIIEYVNYYYETSLYLTISSGDEKKRTHRSVCHGWIAHHMSCGNVVWYYKKDVPTHIQENFRRLGDSIASQIWTNVKLKFGKIINDFFEIQSSQIKCIMIGLEWEKKNVHAIHIT
jgi:hypothetical protein